LDWGEVDVHRQFVLVCVCITTDDRSEADYKQASAAIQAADRQARKNYLPPLVKPGSQPADCRMATFSLEFNRPDFLWMAARFSL
jgi:hypothetical protein